MKSLYLRVWLTVVAALALFALGSGWLLQQHVERERGRAEALASERLAAWGDLIQRSLPTASAPDFEQTEALQEWSQRLHVPLALDDARGRRVTASESFERRMAGDVPPRRFSIQLADGRTLWVMRPPPRPARGQGLFLDAPRPEGLRLEGPRVRGLRFFDGERDDIVPPSLPFDAPGWLRGTGIAAVLLVLFVAVAAGAFPVVRRLTRRLEALKQGVERFGAGALDHRVDASGRDEVAAVAASFNRAAERVEALVRSHQSLLANASHELRSPLARLKMAVEMLEANPPEAQRSSLKHEIATDIAELDALVEEVLTASRLDAYTELPRDEVELLALLVEEGARVGAELAPDAATLTVRGNERLLRRALRNLLENARRYAGGEITLRLARNAAGRAELHVCDRGPGVPEALRERIFEPFFRLPGHAEREGGVGLGLSLVRQIAERHGGSVRCQARDGGGSCFVIELPVE
jgi:signal transduction histidine kinase